jgi:hypothetical protein
LTEWPVSQLLREPCIQGSAFRSRTTSKDHVMPGQRRGANCVVKKLGGSSRFDIMGVRHKIARILKCAFERRKGRDRI